MAKSSIKVELVGLDDLIKLMNDLGKGADKVVTPAAKAGANIALASARSIVDQNFKSDSGNLKKGIIIMGEKKKGAKKVYQVGMDPAMNDVFVKYANGKRYYYPASLMYGFIVHTAKGDYKTEGVNFLKDALVSNVFQIEKAMVEKLSKMVDKEMKKQGKV